MDKDTVADSFSLIIFGITSNLAQKYILQALYDMEDKRILPKNITIVGNARRELGEEEFKEYIRDALNKENRHHQHEIKKEVLEKLLKRMFYLDGYLDNPNFYEKLKNFLDKTTKDNKGRDDRIYYLATYPDLYESIFENLKKYNLTEQKNGYVRVMVEKPLGVDLESARKINNLLDKYFKQEQVFRMDHYLGKETLQNILTFRFGNGIFEPLINNEFVDHIQITASEDFGIGDRGGYYDTVGALKDVGQNHQLQMLAFATMDAPVAFNNDAVTRERTKIFKNLKPLPKKVVYGQYEGYKSEKNVSPTSTTDTFYALKTEIINDRFKGVPIYIRAGKKLKTTVTEIAIVFKTPINRLFKDIDCGMEPNVLIYRLQPNEGIVLKILSKKPGNNLELEGSYMQFCYRNLTGNLPDPYEKLILDAIQGDQTFFNDAEEVEAQWEFTDELIKERKEPIVYKEGGWGPKEADELIKEDGREWLEPSEMFCKI